MIPIQNLRAPLSHCLQTAQVHWTSTLLPAVPVSDIPATCTPVGQPFCALTLCLKHRKWDHSSCSTPEGHSGKRAHAGTEEDSISSEHSTLPIQLVASHSPKHPEPGLIDLCSSPIKDIASPSDRLAVDTLGSTVDHDRDSAVDVSGDDASQSGDESDSSNNSQESAVDSGPESATRDCLICLDTEEAAVNSACKKFWKKVWTSCSITKGCLWLETQLK